MLSVLGDSDLTEGSLRALDLHRHLTARGAQVRTVALGPGTSGGLDAVVPVLAPHPRTIAAGLQLRREIRWCDVVLLDGLTTLAIEHRWCRPRGGIRRVVVLDPARRGRIRARHRRLLATCDVVITTSVACGRRLAGDGVAAVVLPAVARLPGAEVGDAQRQVARRSLGMAVDVPVLGVAAPLGGAGGGEPPARLTSAAARAGWCTIRVLGDGTEHDERCVAACDAVVVEAACPDGSPPRGALAVAAGGGVLVGLGPDPQDLVAEASGLVVADDEDLADALARLAPSTRGPHPARWGGPAGAAAVRRRHALTEVGEGWVSAVLGGSWAS